MKPSSALFLAASLTAEIVHVHAGGVEIQHIETTRDMSNTLSSKDSVYFSSPTGSSSDEGLLEIAVDEEKKYQTIYGIGSSMESSTCYNLMRMNEEDRHDTLKKIFDKEEGIGMNLMRLTVATSDFCPPPFYSYDDSDEPDLNLSKFTIEQDREFILPVLKETLDYVNTDSENSLKFFASSWSPPGWMKTSGKLEGGEYNPDYLEHYADYLVKFLDAYEAEGIPISALTPQNEPLQDEDTYPTTKFPPELEVELIGKHLGPKLANKSTDIWCFDHNWNTPNYPRTVFDNKEASQYVTGSAFHNYGGKPTMMTTLKEEYPDKDMFFSEGSEFGVRGAGGIVDILRNWARTYNAWVTMLDTKMQPNAGPFHPSSTMIELDTETLKPKYRFEYYMYGQFSKFICRGAVRVMSEDSHSEEEDRSKMKHVAFINPDTSSCGSMRGKRVMIVVNANEEVTPVKFTWKDLSADVKVDGYSVSTFTWSDVTN